MLLSIYVFAGELTEGWWRVEENTSIIKSSGTQFYKPDVASEMLSKPASGLWANTTFGCDCFGRSWRSNGVFVAKLLPFMDTTSRDRP